ncbi:MAG: hypothetical protein AB8G86_13270 [Saprospiraceae bacterium]
MKLKDKIQVCENLIDLPSKEMINSFVRGFKYKIIFSKKIEHQREQIGQKWKEEFPNHQIAIHTIEPEINIVKLITEKEIEEHQFFFEQCAKDYRELSTKLINQLAEKFEVKIDSKYPMNTLNASGRNGYEQIGNIGDWKYFFHGIHCAFTNLKTEQYIETPLSYGLEFGELDPYFFSKFINSTNEYKPLPIFIYDDFWDGRRILNKMVELGKFEIINSNFPNQTGVVVKDRATIKIDICPEIEFIPKEEIKFKVKEKLSFWERLKLKIKRRRTHNNGYNGATSKVV